MIDATPFDELPALWTPDLGRPLSLLSLGAGVQSSTVALKALAGELPPIDAAIFADTGWEPAAVYRHLSDVLAPAFAAADVPLFVVTVGNIRHDALDPAHRFASMPLYVRPPDVDCPACAGTGAALELAEALDAGVVDAVAFDSGAEVLVDGRAHRMIVGEVCSRCTGRGKVPNPRRRGMVRRQCTSEYKLKPILKATQRLAGVEPRQRVAGVRVVSVQGISYDESQRMRDAIRPWIVNQYPLVDRRLTRVDCLRWLEAAGVAAPRSACLGCPFHTDHEWRSIRDHDPEGWADAVDFDRAIRAGNRRDAMPNLVGDAFLHPSLVPLDAVDLSTAEDRGQGSMFGDAECLGLCGI